ncbi:hypothetical protein [Paraferrimonas sedimenticola]|nr:hypothetical protein [Paraferrimonas sedimenticola]
MKLLGFLFKRKVLSDDARRYKLCVRLHQGHSVNDIAAELETSVEVLMDDLQYIRTPASTPAAE